MSVLRANYHTHTFRCRHAAGTDRDYVEAALAAGMETLGFSDHAPMIFPKETYGDYYSGFRMLPEETADYFASVAALRAEYRGRIEIRAGVEVEYYPDCFPGFLQFMEQFPLEYMILGQHYVGNEVKGPAVFKETDETEKLEAYYDTVLAAVKTGRFLYIAHPDVISFTGEEAVYLDRTRRFLEKLRELDPVLEVNQHGHMGNRIYPREAFWKLAGEMDFAAVVGVDAHDPAELTDDESNLWCVSLAKKYGLRLQDTLPLPELK